MQCWPHTSLAVRAGFIPTCNVFNHVNHRSVWENSYRCLPELFAEAGGGTQSLGYESGAILMRSTSCEAATLIPSQGIAPCRAGNRRTRIAGNRRTRIIGSINTAATHRQGPLAPDAAYTFAPRVVSRLSESPVPVVDRVAVLKRLSSSHTVYLPQAISAGSPLVAYPAQSVQNRRPVVRLSPPLPLLSQKYSRSLLFDVTLERPESKYEMPIGSPFGIRHRSQ